MFLVAGFVGAVDGEAIGVSPAVFNPVEVVLFGWVFGSKPAIEKLPVVLPVLIFEGRIGDCAGFCAVVVGVEWLIEEGDFLNVLEVVEDKNGVFAEF